jgi:hypothetical protein
MDSAQRDRCQKAAKYVLPVRVPMTVLKVEQASPMALPWHSGSTRSLVSETGAARVDAMKSAARTEMRENCMLN